jgi:hypothetical protein
MVGAGSPSREVMLFGHAVAGSFTGTCGEVLITRGAPSGYPGLLDFKIASRTRINFSDSMIEPHRLTGILNSPALFHDGFASRRNGFVRPAVLRRNIQRHHAYAGSILARHRDGIVHSNQLWTSGTQSFCKLNGVRCGNFVIGQFVGADRRNERRVDEPEMKTGHSNSRNSGAADQNDRRIPTRVRRLSFRWNNHKRPG